MAKKSILGKLLTWRLRHISDRQFIYFLSVVIGFCSGIAAVIIKNLVHLIKSTLTEGFALNYQNYLYFIFPAVGILLTVIIIKIFIKRDVGHGVPKVLYAISKEQGYIRRHNLFSSIVTSVLTVGFGGSVGLEGPTVATGGAIGSNIGRALRLNYKEITLLIVCASAGAMSAIFKSPIAAIVFVLEVIMFDLTLSSIVPILIASATAALTSYFFVGLDVLVPYEVVEKFNVNDTLFYIALGIVCGLISVYFTRIYEYISEAFEKIKRPALRWLTGSLILGFLIFLIPSLYGEGYDSINKCLRGDISYLFDNTFYYDFRESFFFIAIVFIALIILKGIATSVTFASGGIGGMFAPTLFLGANLGLFFAMSCNYFGFHISESNFALVGMAGTISGMLHAPLTSIFLIAEITGGYELFMPLMITGTISYATVRIFEKNSVYTYQLAKRGELMTHDKDKTVLLMMKIDTIIENDFKTIHPNATLRELIEVIKTSSRNIFPVVDGENKFYGIVKLDHIRDIMFDQSKYDTTRIWDLMDMPEYIIRPEESMEEVTKKFQKSSRFTIPVLKQGKYYMGFISRAKLFSAYRKVLKEFSED